MSLFQPGQKVKIAKPTGDDQIDYYFDLGAELEVIAYTPISPLISGYHEPIPNYSLVAPDGIVISANEYELKPVIRRRNKRPV